MAGVKQRVFVATVLLVLLSLADPHGRSAGEALEGSRSGLCRYGPTTSCCPGWRNVNGLCQPICKTPCVHGSCVLPDKCRCSRGFTGALCDEDVNECGYPERPCSQRCMNTHGSYRCFCDPGHTLSADGVSCTRETSCSSRRCQFGCRVEGWGEVRCVCPLGLQLAADNRTCEDVDECQQAADACPPRRTCRNTFGGFVCVCRSGFVLGTSRGAVRCRDQDECLTGSHRCSRYAQCVNTDGSYTCRCLDGYAGTGYACRPGTASQAMSALYFNYKLSKRTRPISPSHGGSRRRAASEPSLGGRFSAGRGEGLEHPLASD